METFKVKYANKKGLTEAVFSGQLVISNIEKITKDVRNNLKTDKSLHLVVKDVDSMDLTFIQLIISLVNSCEKSGNEVSTSIDVPHEIKLLLTNAGFSALVTENK